MNSYAGAVDPDLLIRMLVSSAIWFPIRRKPAHLEAMNHNLAPDPNRFRGLAREPKVGLVGFEEGEREQAYLDLIPSGARFFDPAPPNLVKGMKLVGG